MKTMPLSEQLGSILTGLTDEIAVMQGDLLERQSAANAIAVILKRPAPYPQQLALSVTVKGETHRNGLTTKAPRAPREIPKSKPQIPKEEKARVPGPKGSRAEVRAKVLEALTKRGQGAAYEIAADTDLSKTGAKYVLDCLVREKAIVLVSQGGAKRPSMYGVKGAKKEAPAREMERAPVRRAETARPTEVAKVVAPPAVELVEGRLPVIGNETALSALQRALPLMPERFTKPDLLKVLPLAFTSGAREREIGMALAELRTCNVIKFSPWKRTDGLSEYMRGGAA